MLQAVMIACGRLLPGWQAVPLHKMLCPVVEVLLQRRVDLIRCLWQSGCPEVRRLALDVFADALGVMYGGTRWAAWNALVACPEPEVRRALAPLRASDNVFQRDAADDLLAGDGSRRELRWRFAGKSFRAAGDASLGGRIAERGNDPWQWGIPVLVRHPELEWERYAGLIGGDDELGAGWHHYERYGGFTDTFLPRLRDIACGEDQIRGKLATELLWHPQESGFGSATDACLSYHGIEPTERTPEQIRQAFDRALRACNPEAVAELVAPNPSRSNPLGQDWLLRRDVLPVSRHLGYTLFKLYIRTLPEALGVGELRLPPEELVRDRCALIEREWELLMQFQAFTFGFWVRPRLSLADLKWYCRRQEASESVRRQMVNFLAASVGILPGFEREREETTACLRELFLPLIKSTTNRLVGIYDKGHSPPEARSAVEREFWQALGAYDAFWGAESTIWFPLGSMSSTTFTAEHVAEPPRARGVHPRRHIPAHTPSAQALRAADQRGTGHTAPGGRAQAPVASSG